ncbi:MAG: PAS domain S-box protein [Rhodospirillales bacterium]|nr:PAS domain S-box protein [Rhodospirillales bacterium]
MSLRRIIAAIFAIILLLVSVIGWYAVDVSLSTAVMLHGPVVPLMIMWGVVVLVIVAMGALLDLTVVRPLLALGKSIRSIGTGNLSTRIEKTSDTEIGDLQTAFNRMAEELARREADLRQSQNLLRTVVENIPIRVFWKDRQLRYLGCNTLFAQDAGMSMPEDLLGKDDFQMGWRDQADLYRADDQQVMDLDKPKLGYVEPQTTPDGQTIWLRTSKVPLHEADGNILGLLGVYEDVTERVLATQVLQESEARLREAQRIAHLGSWTLDLMTNKLTWSDENCRIFGFDPETVDATYETFLETVHPDDREFVNQAYQGSVKNRTPYDIEHRLLMKDGRVKWVNERGQTFYDEQHTPVRSTGVTFDITQRKESEAKIRDAFERLEIFRSTIDQSKDLIFVANAETGLFIDINETTCSRLGYSHEELLGMSAMDIETEFPDDFSWNAYIERVRQSDGIVFLGRSLCRDGTSFPVEVSAKVVTLNHREVVIAVVRDVTERIETERALRYAQKIDSLGNLAGGIAHNMNNLLLPILSLTEMTLRDLPEDSRAHKRLGKVVEAATEGKALVQQIMDFSRRSGEDDQAEVADLRDIIINALDLVLVSVPSSIDVTQDLDEPGLRVAVNRGQITTVIMNVISNAVDAFEGRTGKLTFSISAADITKQETGLTSKLHPGRYGKLTITDTGTGMDAQTLERVFDPFFTTKEVGQGKGLGLSTAYSIVEKYKGLITIFSAPQVGTTVTIYLPLVDGDKTA